MVVTDEQLEAMCEAFTAALDERLPYSRQGEPMQAAWKHWMRHALAVLPEPASAADALPVPGAAVRALVEVFRGLAAETRRQPEERRMRSDELAAHNAVADTYEGAADRLEAALRADGMAVELPTRESVVAGLRKAYDDNTYGTGLSDAWEAQTDYVLGLLARRPAADEAALPQPEPVPGAAARFQVTEAEWSTALKLGQPGINYVCLYHVNAVLASRSSTDEAEALRESLACSRDRMRVTAERLDAADRHIADIEGELGEVRDYCAERGQDRDERAVTAVTAVVSWLESQLASLTAERDTARKFGRVAEEERDEALAELAKAEREASAVVCALDDADVPGVVGVDGPVLDCVDKPAVVVGETCGSPGRVKWLANQLEFYRGATEHAEKLIEQLREQLAARPEPVVIDEALAELPSVEALADDLDGHWPKRTSLAEYVLDKYLKPLAVQLQNAEKGRVRAEAGWAEERGLTATQARNYHQLRAEIEKTRAALEACNSRANEAIDNYAARLTSLGEQHESLRERVRAAYEAFGFADEDTQIEAFVDGDYIDLAPAIKQQIDLKCEFVEKWSRLREQLDALRAACTPTEKEAEARDHVKPDRLGASDWTVRQLAGFYDRAQAARLKPAPAEAEPVRCDFGDECPGHASPDDRPCGWEPASPADALRPNDRHGMVGAAEQVLRHASEPDCEPIADWVAKRGLPGVPASLKPLTERVERLEVALRTFLTSWTPDDPRPRPQAAVEALEALDALKGGGK